MIDVGPNLFLLILLLLVIGVILAGVKTVPQGYQFTVERFRRYTKTLMPGLNLIVPFIDRIGNKVNVMEQVLDVPTQEVITKDNATVSVDGVAFFQVFDAARASYEVAQLDLAILALTMTNIRTVMGSMDLDQLLSHRDTINERLLHVVDAAAAPWGVKMRLRRFPLAAVKPGAVIDPQVLGTFDMGYDIDNMEGLAISRNKAGETILTLISDDNFNFFQRTVLLRFALTGK